MSPRSVSDLERGINRTAHKDTAVLLAGALGLTGQAGELFVAAARGKAPAADVLAAARRAAPGPTRSGDRVSLPRAEGVRGAGRGVLLRPRNGHRPGAGPDVAAGGGRGPAGGVGGVGSGEVVAAAGGGAAAHPGRGAGSRARITGLAARVVHPDPGAAGRAGAACGGAGGGSAAAVRRELEDAPAWFALTARQAALAGPPGPAGDSDGLVAEQDRQPAQRRVVLVVDQFEELFTQCRMRGSGGRSSPRCARPPPPATARTGPRRRWSCWACAPTLRPGAPTTRSWPARSKTGTWSRR